MIAEQRNPSLFDNRQAFVAVVIDDVDCDPGDLRRTRTGSCKRTAEIAKHLARLSRKVTMANKLAVYVFRLLARDQDQLASRCLSPVSAIVYWNRNSLEAIARATHPQSAGGSIWLR
jgi:hypothetical protein